LLTSLGPFPLEGSPLKALGGYRLRVDGLYGSEWILVSLKLLLYDIIYYYYKSVAKSKPLLLGKQS
jgi:hypothetical protein